ncbi:hypothetical protein KSS87_008908 [Heliosperma pusillum]|nr:hypothetical protein KSS87_008908 [Heliosperma pusillum]
MDEGKEKYESFGDSLSEESLGIEDERGCEIVLLEEPILEKFEVFCSSEEKLITDSFNLISFTPLLEPMIVGEDCEESLKRVSLAFGLMCDLESRLTPPLVDLRPIDQYLSVFEIFGIRFFPHKFFINVLLHSWLCGSPRSLCIACDHFFEDWSSSFDKLMRSLMGFLGHLFA